MNATKKSTVYFKEAGPTNTGTLQEIVKEYIETEEINHVVVASTTGRTGARAAKLLQAAASLSLYTAMDSENLERANWTQNSRRR